MATKTNIRLPDYKPNRKRAVTENGWSENYGATLAAAQYAGITIKSPLSFQGFWQHGCFGPWELEIPGVSTYFKNDEFRDWPVFVARTEEEILLQKQGLTKARAIGLPIVYATYIEQPRLPESLLIVPTHTLAGMKNPDRSPLH